MAVTDCPTDLSAPQVTRQLLAEMFGGELPTSLRTQADGSASAADVFSAIDRLWERAIADCEKEKSK